MSACVHLERIRGRFVVRVGIDPGRHAWVSAVLCECRVVGGGSTAGEQFLKRMTYGRGGCSGCFCAPYRWGHALGVGQSRGGYRAGLEPDDGVSIAARQANKSLPWKILLRSQNFRIVRSVLKIRVTDDGG